MQHAQHPELWARQEARRECADATLHAPRVKPHPDEVHELAGSPRSLHEADDFA